MGLDFVVAVEVGLVGAMMMRGRCAPYDRGADCDSIVWWEDWIEWEVLKLLMVKGAKLVSESRVIAREKAY
jgi:hypothetical protein